MIYQITMSVMSKALSNPRARDRAVKVLNRWAEAETRSLRYAVAWNLQQRLSEATGYPICGYCQWVEFPDDLHSECREQLGIPMPEDKEERPRNFRIVETTYSGDEDTGSFTDKRVVWEGDAGGPKDFDDSDFLDETGILFMPDHAVTSVRGVQSSVEFDYRLEEEVACRWEFVKELNNPAVSITTEYRKERP